MKKSRERFWYLATPYSGYPKGMTAAYDEARKQAALLMAAGVNVFCPIAHSHPIFEAGAWISKPLPATHEFWVEKQDKALLDNAYGLIVCKMEGWEKSRGVAWEIGYATAQGKSVVYMEPGVVPETFVRSPLADLISATNELLYGNVKDAPMDAFKTKYERVGLPSLQWKDIYGKPVVPVWQTNAGPIYINRREGTANRRTTLQGNADSTWGVLPGPMRRGNDSIRYGRRCGDPKPKRTGPKDRRIEPHNSGYANGKREGHGRREGDNDSGIARGKVLRHTDAQEQHAMFWGRLP